MTSLKLVHSPLRGTAPKERKGEYSEARAEVSDEVQVLRFFEDAPLEKAQVVLNIVLEKMRSRGAVNPGTEGRTPQKKEKHSKTGDVVSPQGEAS